MLFLSKKNRSKDSREVVNKMMKVKKIEQLKHGQRNKMSTASTHAHNENLKLMLNLTNTLQMKSNKFHFKR